MAVSVGTMKMTLSVAIMQVTISVAIMEVLRLYFNYADSTFCYSYVGGYLQSCMWLLQLQSCSTFANDSFCIKFVGDSFYCIYAGGSLCCNYASGTFCSVYQLCPYFLENKQNSSLHPLCNVVKIQLWLTKTNYFTYLLP